MHNLWEYLAVTKVFNKEAISNKAMKKESNQTQKKLKLL